MTVDARTELVLTGNGMRLLLAAATRGDERGLHVEVDHARQGHAAVVLEPHEVAQVRDYLDAWLAAAPVPTG